MTDHLKAAYYVDRIDDRQCADLLVGRFAMDHGIVGLKPACTGSRRRRLGLQVLQGERADGIGRLSI